VASLLEDQIRIGSLGSQLGHVEILNNVGKQLVPNIEPSNVNNGEIP
jgi:hypothetical protein